MINLRELRLGNLISFHGQPDIVCEIGAAENGYCERNGYFNSDQGYIAPIPLTPEWLERMGFETDGEGDDFHDKPLWKNPSTAYLYCEAGYFVDNNGPYGHYCDIGDIQYVHQLQNLYYALTGEEIEIKQPVS